jgi:hypothetical protein
MVLQIIHLIVLAATLTCGLVVAFYAQRIHATQSRELAFLNDRDIGEQRYRSEARHVRQAWNTEIRTWLGDTGALLGKLSAIAEESSPEGFPGTMVSMPSVRGEREEPIRARPTPRVETKAICRECDGGFVAVGNGGIGQCYACNGSGFIDAR